MINELYMRDTVFGNKPISSTMRRRACSYSKLLSIKINAHQLLYRMHTLNMYYRTELFTLVRTRRLFKLTVFMFNLFDTPEV